MTWFKLDDQFHSQPKVIAAGNAAIGLYCRLGTFCADKLTDGFVPDAVARSMGSSKELKALTHCPIPDTRALLTVVEGGFMLRDYLEYNPTREKVLAERAAAKARMQRRRGSLDVRPNTNPNDVRSSRSPDPDPLLTGSTETTDDLQSAEPSSVVNGQHLSRAIERLAELLWPDAQVRYSIPAKTRNAWLNGTTKNLWNERRHELEALLTEGLTPEQAAEHAYAPPEPERHLSVVRATCDNPECVNGLIPDDPASDTPLWARCPSCNSLEVAQ